MELTATIAAGTATGDFVKDDYRIAVIGVTEPGEPPVGQEPEEPSVVEPEVQGIIVNSASKGIMAKGEVRKFTAQTEGAGDVLQDPVWTVEGASADGGTIINKNGQLKIGAYETSITLRVRATSPANPDVWGSVAVKVQGWVKIEGIGSLFDIIGDLNKTGILGLSYGNGVWVMAGHYNDSKADSATAIAYSTDNGLTWKNTGTHLTNARDYPTIIAYEGPEGAKRFFIGTQMANIAYSSNGKTWTYTNDTRNIFHDEWNYPATYSSGSYPIRSLVYGVVKKDGADTGIYVAGSASKSTLSWSLTGTTKSTWNPVVIPDDMKPGALDIFYGAGIVGGQKVPMFFAEGQYGNAYATDAADWVVLSDADKTVLAFTAVPATGWVNHLPPADTSNNPSASLPTLLGGSVKFIARGGPAGSEIYIAVGPGNTAAYAHAE